VNPLGRGPMLIPPGGRLPIGMILLPFLKNGLLKLISFRLSEDEMPV
jgi:hypothetical protein